MTQIAFCGVSREMVCALKEENDWEAVVFTDASDRRGDVQLAYAMRDGFPAALAVIGYAGAAGLVACDYLQGQSGAPPIIWLCTQKEFEREARRMGICFCYIGTPNGCGLSEIRGIIRKMVQG